MKHFYSYCIIAKVIFSSFIFLKKIVPVIQAVIGYSPIFLSCLCCLKKKSTTDADWTSGRHINTTEI